MFEFNIDDNEYSHIYFMGIGGISMSGLAEILVTEGYKVSGSDIKESKVVERLRNLGIKVHLGQKSSNIAEDVDLIIYTDAISKDNPELMHAKKNNIKLVDRARFLGAIMKNYDNSIAVSGTHGKTTTTSMLSTILNNSSVNPTILLGGQLSDIGGNVRLGSRECLLTEACEYKGNILKYFPSMAIIMNMDEDHLDYFKSIDHIVDTFASFSKNIREDGHLIINTDDQNAQKVIESSKAKIVSFGLEGNPIYKAENISYNEASTDFDLIINNKFIDRFTLNFIGKHNVYNALASIAASHIFGLDLKLIKENIGNYKGVDRRLQLKGILDGVKVIDDYAHHPTEIEVTLKAVKESIKNTGGKIYCVFQPHTFTRTQKLFQAFASAFEAADVAIITDIYAARESDDGSVHSRDLALAIENTESLYLENFGEIKDYLLSNMRENDIVLTMGAGNIFELGELLLKTKCAV